MPVTIHQQCVHTLKDIKYLIWTDEFPYITYEHLYTSMLCVALDDIYSISDDRLLYMLLLGLSDKRLGNVCISQALNRFPHHYDIQLFIYFQSLKKKERKKKVCPRPFQPYMQSTFIHSDLHKNTKKNFSSPFTATSFTPYNAINQLKSYPRPKGKTVVTSNSRTSPSQCSNSHFRFRKKLQKLVKK